jgi:hypothetical protein
MTRSDAAPAWPRLTEAPQLFQTFFHGTFSAFETMCLRSFVDHGHRVRVYAYDHASTPAFCEQADARALLPADRVFFYQSGYGAGSVSAFSNLFRYTLLLQNGGWWIDTDVACLAAAWPDGDVVAATEDGPFIGSAVMRFPPGHPVMKAAVAACIEAGENVAWGEAGPALLTRVVRENGLGESLHPPTLFYPLHWSEWIDVIDPACGAAVTGRTQGAVALHLWNEQFRSNGFHRVLAPPEGSFLHRLATRHGGLDNFVPSDARVFDRQIALARENEQRIAATRAPTTSDMAEPEASTPRRCVYTALTGRYETLTEQPVARQSQIPFICFTDDPDLVSETWEIRPLERLFKADSIRSQRECKLRPHRYLSDFDASLYIDNSVLLKVTPEAIFDAVDLSSGLSLPLHSYRPTIRDEFDRVESQQLDDPARIAEQREHYAAENPDILTAKPFWSAIMVRDHHNQVMIAAMEHWLSHILRYARRDQLSNRFAFDKVGLVPHVLAIDNFDSCFHSWPQSRDRNHAMRNWKPEQPSPSVDPQTSEMDARYNELATAYDAVIGSTTWRLMEPIRSAVGYLRNRRG